MTMGLFLTSRSIRRFWDKAFLEPFTISIVALDPLCSHCGSSYIPSIRILQLCPVVDWSLKKVDCCTCWAMAKKRSKSRRKPSVKFWLVTPTLNQVLRLAILTILRKRNSWSSKPRQKSYHRLQQVADCQPGDRLKEQKYSSFCRSSKRCEKVRLHTSTKIARHCACLCFSQKLFICWCQKNADTFQKIS